MKYLSSSPRITQKIAFLLAQEIIKTRPRASHALAVALQGDLGSGKTTFTQGFARGLGIKRRLTSPTFIIVRKYNLRSKKYERFFHIDAYRIKKISDLRHLGWKEMMHNRNNVVLIEWADNVKRALPKHAIWINFKHSTHNNERGINIKKRY